jgi:hypothetical protein
MRYGENCILGLDAMLEVLRAKRQERGLTEAD